VCGTEIVVFDREPLQEVDDKVLAPSRDKDRMILPAPKVDGVTKEVNVAWMSEVNQYPH
jgi:hypothetical protein